MRRTPYGEFTAFMAVAEQRNFTKAAKQIGIATATLSETISAFEERLGVRLLNRTTRSVSVTEAGERLMERLKPLLDQYEAALDSVNAFRDTPSGLVRLTVAPPAVPSVIAPMLARFTTLYPDIRLEIAVDSANVDIVSQQYDAGIRAANRIDHDMIAVRLTDDMRTVVVGSPSYFAQHKRPTTPQELTEHNCIRMRLSNGALIPWRFEKGGKIFEVPVSGTLILNDVELVGRAVLDGIGLAAIPRVYVEAAIAGKQFVPVLEGWMPVGSGLSLYYPSRRQTPAALQALIDFVRKDEKSRRAGR